MGTQIANSAASNRPHGSDEMYKWRFFQGILGEWRWYKLSSNGEVVTSSDGSFAELPACMSNAELAGFDGHSCQVHARSPGSVGHQHAVIASALRDKQ